MPREKSIPRRTNMIVASSYNNTSDNHELLGAHQEQAPVTQAAMLNAGSLSTMLPY
jgi:hypothetical protein